MNRSREFGPTAPYAAGVDTYVPLEKPNHTLSRLLLAGSAVGLAISFNFIADGLSAEAWVTPSATSVSTATSTPIPTGTPTSVRSRATVVVSGDGEVSVEVSTKIDNTNSNSNDLTQRLIDALLRPAPTQVPTSSPRPTDTPTPTDADNNLAAARTAVAEGKKEKTAGDLLGQATALAQPTPDRTETREAQKTAGREEILGRQATLTAAVPPAIARAQKTATALEIQKEAAELEAENRRTEERIRNLQSPSPSPTPRGQENGGGGFPWGWAITLGGAGIGAGIFARRRIITFIHNHTAPVAGPAVPPAPPAPPAVP